uniref:Uncharacterized protein n=1 Tax=Rhodnius prolixus TaxID=13249 RepID=T1IFB9_RHOPR
MDRYMMFGGMLVGAWLLIHGQCCVNAGTDSRIRSPLVDPLIRRSPLEKNFMRFGRSSPALQQFPTAYNSNYLDLENSKRSGRFDRARDNFMRFGRDNEKIALSNRAKDNFIRFGRSKDNFMRFGRIKDNFIRFGRGNDNFMRFGRSGDEIEEILPKDRRDKALNRLGRQRLSDKSDNFIRFGRASSDDNEMGDMSKSKRSPIYMDEQKIQEECHEGVCQQTFTKEDTHQHQQDFCPPELDPNIIVAPEFSLLPSISMKPRIKPKISSNFLRLG